MLKKSDIHLVRSLHDKQTRKSLGLFIVEGEKNLLEFLESDSILHDLFVTSIFEEKYSEILKKYSYKTASEKEIEKMGTLESNKFGIGVFHIKKLEGRKKESITLVLDGINDPGNLGTIIRTADWYGISHIVASEDTVDCYNPKVVMATKGSLHRVMIEYMDLEVFFSKQKKPVYGAFLEGEDIHQSDWQIPCCIVIGSESHGIRKNVSRYVSKPITIPRYGGAESLNAGVATAIILDQMRTKLPKK